MDRQTQKFLLNLVKQNYDEIAVNFDITRHKHPWPELLKLTECVKDGDSILDVGCGNGRLLDAINKNVIYTGVDSSKKLLEIAKNKLSHPNFQFIEGDLLELGKIPHINFNWVFCIAVLHHIPGKDLRLQALKQLKNKVAGDGRVIITVWNLWSQAKFRKLVVKYALLKMLGKNKMELGDIIFEWKEPSGRGISSRYYHSFNRYELKRLVRRAGLKLEKIYKDNYNYYLILKK
jgi:ubiquinone/menaquinone biosynthesis C-methylase UbiE